MKNGEKEKSVTSSDSKFITKISFNTINEGID